MTLKEKVQQALGALAPFASGTHTLTASEGGQQLTCHLVALDSLACSFTQLLLADTALEGLSTAELKRCAERLSAKLTYLLEPISPIETDAEGCVVQMRSNPPQKEADRTSYYELLVARAGHLSLARYSRAAGQTREAVPAHLTREVLSRLVGDFSTASAR